MQTAEDFFAHVHARFNHPKLEFISDRVDENGIPFVRFRNHSFNVLFDVFPDTGWPDRYHAQTKKASE